MQFEEPLEADVDELVAVEREDVTRFLPALRGEPDPAAAAHRLGLANGDDLRADAAQGALEMRLLTGRAADEHALHAHRPELLDLVGGQRPAPDLDERLGLALRGLAEPLGLAARQDDRFH